MGARVLLGSGLGAVRLRLPRGGLLPFESWRGRHRAIVVLLWLHVVAFTVYSLIQDDLVNWHTGPELGAIALLALLATWPRTGRTPRTVFAALGLIACSALLVHRFDDFIEVHFHFFVVLAVIALYEEWAPFLLALGYSAIDHEPSHEVFMLAASVVSVVRWRLNETERLRASAEQGERVRVQAARQSVEAELASRKEVEARLQHQAARLEEQARLLELAQDAILVWDIPTGAIRFWNRGAEELYGWSRDEVLGRTPSAVLETQFPGPLADINADLVRTGRWEGELIHTRRDGSKAVVTSRWALREGDGDEAPTVLAINSNITEQKQAQAALEHQALHDALTGLPNRTLLGNRLQEVLAAAEHDGGSVALLMLDLDRFKDVNDTLGHDSGDRLLSEVGPRLLSHLRKTDTLARLGGDEFAVLLPNTSFADAQIVGRKLLQSLEWPFVLDASNVTIGGSVGIALHPEHASDAETLLRCADVAMYVAKRSGTGLALYAAAEDQHSRDRLAIGSDLRRAIEAGEFVLHYQPKLSCLDGSLAGVEALVRWQHPERGLVPPDQFISLAEQTGLIGLLDSCVLELALRQSHAWRAIGLVTPIAVNLSMREVLDPDLPRDVERMLASWRVDPGMLRMEITEGSLMVDPMRARETLAGLCELGVRLSIDDYGTGYSSLRYLQQLPVDELKIDRSFVQHMVARESDFVIVRSTVELAHALGLRVVAEGVEDAATWERLAAVGCDQAQGYYLSRPVPADALVSWLQDRDSYSLAA